MVCEHLFPKPKLLILNYPHNPTAMTVDPGFFEPVVDLAKHFKFLVIHDFAYGETLLRRLQGPQLPGGQGRQGRRRRVHDDEQALQHGRLARRLLAGNKQMIDSLATIKGYYDYGIFQAIQIAGIIAMRHCDKRHRRPERSSTRPGATSSATACERLGWQVEKPRASMFVWAKVAEEHLNGKGTIDFAMDLMEDAEVAIAPGRAFGENGEGYVRIALVENEQRLRQAIRNISRYVQQKPIRKAKAAK